MPQPMPPRPPLSVISRSKYRQTRGDEQLDRTYTSSPVAHHISAEPLSELSYCIYKARQLDLTLLARSVRTVFQVRRPTA